MDNTTEPKYTDMRALLPWYVNGTLTPDEQCVVEAWLRDNPQAQAELVAWQQVSLTVERQAVRAPSSAVRERVLAAVRPAVRPPLAPPAQSPAPTLSVLRQRLTWVWGAAMTLSVLLALWVLIRPGVTLQWSVTAKGESLTVFRVYRAPVGGADFGLLMEVPAQTGVHSYTYVDRSLLPGRTYIYRVEGIGQGGQLALSQATAGNALGLLLVYIAMLAVSLLAGYAAMMLAQRGLPAGQLGALMRLG